MLKITIDQNAPRLVLEGSLAGPWVDTLDESWRGIAAAHPGRTVAVDLSEVTFVDPRGKQLLASIYGSGGRLTATGMNAALIKDIADCNDARRERLPRSFFWLVGALASLTLFGAACSENGAPEAPVAAESARPPVAVDVAPAVAADLTEAVDVVGSLSPKFAAEIKSEVSGTVTAVYVTEWVPVRTGTRLARLNTSENDAAIEALKAAEAQARVSQARARREHERALQLKEYGLITTQALEDARTALEAADAATSGAQAQVRAAEARLSKSFITSPMNGVVAFRGVNVGDRVENVGGNDPMFRIVDNRLLNLTVSVPTAQSGAIRVGQALEFSVDALPGRTFTGKVMFINPEAVAASRSVNVIAEVRNTDDALKGGLFAKGRIVISTRRGVLQVPRAALLNWDVAAATAHVFVVRDGKAEKRDVKTGPVDGANVAIESGLTAGDQVITRGGFAVKPGDPVAVSGEGA